MNRGKTQIPRKAVPLRSASEMEDQSPTLSNEVNGKVNGHAPTGKSAALKPEVSENIFLFYPNIIGVWLSLIGY